MAKNKSTISPKRKVKFESVTNVASSAVRSRSYGKEISKLQKENKSLYNKLYYRKKKLEQGGDKKYISGIRREIKRIDNQRDEIQITISAYREEVSVINELREDRKQILRDQKKINARLEKLYESGGYDTKEFKELTNKHLRLSDKLHVINQELGVEENVRLSSEEKAALSKKFENKYAKRKNAIWSNDPMTPHTIWQAMAHLEDSLNNNQFEYYVIAGKSFENTDMIGIGMEASNMWRITKSFSSTPYIIISYDPENKGVQYDPVNTA